MNLYFYGKVRQAQKLFSLRSGLILFIHSMLFVFLLAPSTSYAHPLSASYTHLSLQKEISELTFSIDSLSVLELLELENEKGVLDDKILTAEMERIEEIITDSLVLEMNGEQQAEELKEIRLEQKGEQQYVTLSFLYPAFMPGESISIIDGLYALDLNTNYLNLITVENGEQVSEAILRGNERTWTMLLTESQEDQQATGQEGSNHGSALNRSSNSASWYSFFKLGMEHIITGYDHLLFLFALLLRKQSLKQYAAIITSFTIAHSFTLTLAVLGWVELPSRFVEAVIAFSICYVAFENIFRKEIRYRWGLTFLFGLIHGLGFASILKEMDIPKGHLAASLVSFNIGIEVVQLALVVLFLPLLTQMQQLKYSKQVVITGSSGIIFLGGIWLVERIFL